MTDDEINAAKFKLSTDIRTLLLDFNVKTHLVVRRALFELVPVFHWPQSVDAENGAYCVTLDVRLPE